MKRKGRRDGGTEGRRGEGSARDQRIVGAVCRWFEGNARELPWRVAARTGASGGRKAHGLEAHATRDPYRSLVSEFMLQQTQVARVLGTFGPFMARFPTVGALARADEQSVIAAWSGMGYYRRARNLHAAAKEIEARFGGRVPERVEDLVGLPGIGRYTAGAVASIVFGRAEPIVDGNVARVLLRVEGKELGQSEGVKWAWRRAGELVEQSSKAAKQQSSTWRGRSPGVFNEGLMELGAVVCTPRGARCGECPLRRECRALAMGKVEEIPRPKERGKRTKLYCAVVVLEDGRGRVLLERRGDAGMWAGLWQAPTLEGRQRAARRVVEEWIGVVGLARVQRFAHGTTHRDVEFEVWRGPKRARIAAGGRVWTARAELDRLGLSNAQKRVLLAERPGR